MKIKNKVIVVFIIALFGLLLCFSFSVKTRYFIRDLQTYKVLFDVYSDIIGSFQSADEQKKFKTRWLAKKHKTYLMEYITQDQLDQYLIGLENKLDYRNENGEGVEGLTIALKELLAITNSCQLYNHPKSNCLENRINFLEKLDIIPAFKDITKDIKLQSSYIKIVKQIDLEGNDFNWNPSIIDYKGHYLIAFRSTRNMAERYSSKVYNRDDYFDNNFYIAEFDKDFNIIGSKQNISQYIPGCTDELCTAQDPRLFKFKDNIYVLYNMSESFSQGSERINKIAKLTNKNGEFILEDFKKISLPFLPSKKDKNWMPLVYKDKLLFVYLVEPKTIVLELNLKNGLTSVYSDKSFISDYKFGTIRGSTGFLPVGKNEYLSFFHSVVKFKFYGTVYIHYYMSSLIMKCEDNCTVEKIATTPLLPFFSSYDANNLSVFFPSGLLITDDEIIITLGKADENAYVVVLDKQKYLATLKKASNLAKKEKE